MKHKDYWKNALIMEAPTSTNKKMLGGRANSDEHYVIDLCDECLNSIAQRQHCFDFLRGDPSEKLPKGRMLPVDAYYPALNLVVEYYERQHTESVKLFNKEKTVSGVSRDEQRRIYDMRRKTVLPNHGINLVIISCTDFNLDGKKRIIRNKESDLNVVRKLLNEYL